MSHFCGPSPNSLISAKEDGKPYLFIYLFFNLFIYVFIYFRLVNSSKQNPDFCDLELVSSATLPVAACSSPLGRRIPVEWSNRARRFGMVKNGAAVVPVVGQRGEVWSDWWLKSLGSFRYENNLTYERLDLSGFEEVSKQKSSKSHLGWWSQLTSTDSVDNSELNFWKSPWKTDLAGDPPVVSWFFTTYNPMKLLDTSTINPSEPSYKPTRVLI